MKVAHLTVVTPGRCGLYETARELVSGLRHLDIDSRLVDPDKENNKLHPTENSDRGAPIDNIGWALDADIIVCHSGLGEETRWKQPVILVCHGRPRHSFLSEVSGSTPIYSYHYRKNEDPKFKSVVTFWPEHVAYHKVMFPDKPVLYVPSSVDLEHWSPGKRAYDFGGHKGSINVVIADAFRDDFDPFVPINAFALWARTTKGAKLHLYGRPHDAKRGWDALFVRLRKDGTLGQVLPWVKGLEHIYRAADVSLTANQIDTRSVRESMACGCPVIKVDPNLDKFNTDILEAMATPREQVRAMAEQNFDPAVTARQFKRILECTVS